MKKELLDESWYCENCEDHKCADCPLMDNAVVERNEKIIELLDKKDLWMLNLNINDEKKNTKVFFLMSKWEINKSNAIIELEILNRLFIFYIDYDITNENHWNYWEEDITKTVNHLKLKNIELRDIYWKAKTYEFTSQLNKTEIKHFIVREILNNYKFNEHLEED